MRVDPAIRTLLDLDGSILDQGTAIGSRSARLTEITERTPHGIHYSLTLHEPHGKRILGYDNAHTESHQESISHTSNGKDVMKPILIGIMPQEKIRERVLAIARGHYKPQPDEPKVWFTSMKSLAEVLSDENRALLHAIVEAQPESISALAEATGRKPSNLSRTLKTMSNYGIVELKRERNQVRPIANATEFRIVAR